LRLTAGWFTLPDGFHRRMVFAAGWWCCWMVVLPDGGVADANETQGIASHRRMVFTAGWYLLPDGGVADANETQGIASLHGQKK